jgi:hypothetical protein
MYVYIYIYTVYVLPDNTVPVFVFFFVSVPPFVKRTAMSIQRVPVCTPSVCGTLHCDIPYVYLQCRSQRLLKQVQFFMSSVTISLLILSRLSRRQFVVCLPNLKFCVSPFSDSNPYRDKEFFLFCTTPRPHLGPTHSCISVKFHGFVEIYPLRTVIVGLLDPWR